MKFILRLFFLLILSYPSLQAIAQLTVTGGMPAQQLVQNVLLGAGVAATNITYTGAPAAIGRFNGSASNIGLNSGILLTTGNISNAPGPNNSGSSGTDNGLLGDSLLAVLSGDTTLDAAILQFDFVPLADTLRFRYVFGSEEYNEFVCAQVNDVFGFFISGPGIVGQQNIALIPNTSTPVSINTLNNGSLGTFGSAGPGCILSHSGFFVDNDNPPGATVQYDGFTTVLTAEAVVIPCLTYHIRIAIADGGDHIYDSGVFLESGSFTAGVHIVAATLVTSGIQTPSGTVGCAPFAASFSNTSTGTNHFFWDFGDGSPADTVTNPTHVYMQGGTYYGQLIAEDTSACNFSDTAYFTMVIDSGRVVPDFNLVQTGFCDSLRVDVTTASTGVQQYEWNFGDNTTATGTSASHTFTDTGTYHVYHIVTDTLCGITDSVFKLVTLEPKLFSTISTNSTSGCSPLSLFLCYPGATTRATQYQWNFGNGNSSSLQCDSAQYTHQGNYVARLIITDTTFCNRIDTSFINIHVQTTPEASFNLPDSQCVLNPVQIENTSSDALMYYWDFDDSHISALSDPDHQYIHTGTYNICLTVYNGTCFDTTCHLIKVFENPQAIWFPGAFTPNGDGINDFFTVDGIGITSFQMIIFNRWGLLIFESDALKLPWDGSFQGRPVEAGIYVVHIKATLLDATEIERFGTVTVLR